MEKLLEHIRGKAPVSEELKAGIEESFQKRNYSKNESLVKEQKYVRKLFFVEEGTLRTYYHHEDRDVTTWIYKENQFLTSWYGFYNQSISYESIEALEDCTVYWIAYEQYINLIDQYSEFERFARLLAEEQLAFIDHYSQGYMFKTAKEKYDLLIAYFPDVTLRVKLGHIASLLGISQETLSRIRRKN